MRELPEPLESLDWRGPGAPSAESVAERLRVEGVAPMAWSNGPDDRYGRHRHGYDKLLMCAAGSITFLVGADDTPVALAPGDGFVLPAGVEHAAIVGPEGCTCVEGHR